jgi:hypothetical protein
MVLELVRLRAFLLPLPSRELFHTGWYDSVYDEELGHQPCIYTSVTPVRRLVMAPRRMDLWRKGVE